MAEYYLGEHLTLGCSAARLAPATASALSFILTFSQCNREWPCNHCQKRKVADKCRFIQPNAASSPPDSLTQGSDKKRSRSRDDDDEPEVSEPEDDDDDVELAAMGYAAGPLLESLTIDSKVSPELSGLKMQC